MGDSSEVNFHYSTQLLTEHQEVQWTRTNKHTRKTHWTKRM